MNLLLDTHILLWWLEDSPSLPKRMREAIIDPKNSVYVSSVSIWEIIIKKNIGKLTLPESWSTTLNQERFIELPVSWEHVSKLECIEQYHNDPFDRLLIAQAVAESLRLVTADKQILQYDLPLFY